MFEVAYAMSLIHRLRGAAGMLFDKLPNRVIVMLAVALLAWITTHSYQLTAIIAVGYFIFIIFGWGAYYITPADFEMNPNMASRQKEIPPIDWLIAKLPPYRLIQNFIGMFLRGLFIAPVFIAYYWLGFNDKALWLIPIFGLCMAVSYYIPPALSYVTKWNFDYNSYCEGMVGGFLGVLLSMHK